MLSLLLLGACKGTPLQVGGVDGQAGSGSGGFITGSGGGPGAGPDADPDARPGQCESVEPIFMNKCLACHSTGNAPMFGGFDMEKAGWAEAMVGGLIPDNAPATNLCKGKGFVFLERGTLPARGLFIDKLQPAPPCGARMPQIGMLTPTELICIENWANGVVVRVGAEDPGGAGGSGGSVADAAVGDGGLPPGCATANTIFQNKCLACHSTASAPSFGGFDMEKLGWAQAMIGGAIPDNAPPTNKCAGQGFVFLERGTMPARGLFLDKFKPTPPCGVRMPQIGTVTAAEVTCIQNWANNIVAGGDGS
jgi:hypothetical protein